MEVMKGNKEAAMMINKKLSEVCESATKHSIYKVHKQYLHNNNNKLFEPGVVAIGAYHRGKQDLAMMEEHKLRYLKSLLLRKGENVERYILAASEMEQAARSCYAEAIPLTATEFIEMLVLDACFIIELLRRSIARNSTNHDHDHDPIFEMKWILVSLQRDLILFENQIPFFVLCKMFDLIVEPNQHQTLIQNFLLFFKMEEIVHVNTNSQEVRHLLHLMHATIRPSFDVFINLQRCDMKREFRLIPTATELKDANVSFRKNEGGENKYEFDFKNGVLTVRPIAIQDDTESVFRNLLVYEQYFPDGQPKYMTDFVELLDCLIHTGRDIELLSECGIIENRVGDNQVAADIVNRLTYSLILSEAHFMHGDTFSRINAHYKKPWNRARAALNRDYFNTPWAYISFVAAVLLLLLTLAQTVFSVLQLS